MRRAGPLALGIVIGVFLALLLAKPRKPLPPSPSPALALALPHSPLLCVLMGANPLYQRAARSTWTRHCDGLYVTNDTGTDRQHRGGQPLRGGPKSSFHVLCDLIRKVGSGYPHMQWFLFVKDDMFVIPNNFRRLVTNLNASEGYYLGHSINFWGVDYNVASAGFALSRNAVEKIVSRFPSTESCISGGKYWKQEDLYLGKHLRVMNIFPSDTRDEIGNTLFFAYDLDKIMFPNSIHQFSNFYTRAIYPVKCCGNRIISFQVLSYTEIYRYYYMVYTLRVFPRVTGKNLEPPTPKSDDYVWQEFLSERGLPFNISNREYEKSWFLKIGNSTFIPSNPKSMTDNVTDNFNFTNMPDILAGVSRTSFHKPPHKS